MLFAVASYFIGREHDMMRMSALRKVLIVGGLVAIALASVSMVDGSDVMTIEVTVSPSTLTLTSQGQWVTVHTDIAYGAVEKTTLELNGIAVAWTKADDRGYLVGKFNLDDVKDIVAPPSVELTMSGVLYDGIAFEGTDIVRVIDGTKK